MASMKIQMHELLGRSHFEALKREFDESIQRSSGWLAAGEGDAQALCRGLLVDAYTNACNVLILGGDDAEAIRYFGRAMDYALRALGAVGSSKRPRVFDAQFEVAEKGARAVAVHEIVPKHRGPAKLTIVDYYKVLRTTTCFGSKADIETAAQYSEDGYRSPEIVAPEGYFVQLRMLKEYLLGDVDGAKSGSKDALASAPAPVITDEINAFLAMLDGDANGFVKNLEKRLAGHKKEYQKKPNDPEGVICQPGLMLCRLAIDRGISVEDWPYLPVRLLPNYKPIVH